MSDPTLVTMLVPGSIWYRETSGKKSLVLFVTNQSLRGKVAEKNPSQVVFMTEENTVLSQGVDQFLASRTFFSMDPRMEAILMAILSDEEDHEEAAEAAPEAEQEEAVRAIDAMAEESSVYEATFETESALKLNVGPHQYAQLLKSNLVAYEESPFYTGDTCHKLTFALEDGLTLSMIRDSFMISDPNAIQKFVLSTPAEDTMVDIDSYVDTLLSADEYRQYGVVYLVSPGDFRAKDEPSVSASIPGLTEVPAPLFQQMPLSNVVPPQELAVNPNGLLTLPTGQAGHQQVNNI